MGLFRRRRKPDAGSGPVKGPDAGAAADPPANAPRTVHERIEVTVERVWVSMLVRNSPTTADGPAAGDASAENEVKSRRVPEGPDSDPSKRD